MTTETAPTETADPSTPPAKEKPSGSWVVAFLFWGTMLVAGGLYAAVALSPKLIVYLHLRDEHYRTQVELVTLEHRVLYLKKVMHALENDPEFAAEHARVELGAERPGDERIAVDERLHFTPDAEFDPSVFQTSILPWYTPLLEVFATDRKTRQGLLIAAVSLSLFAFTFLQDSQVPQLLGVFRGIKNFWLRATARYRTCPSTASDKSPASADPHNS